MIRRLFGHILATNVLALSALAQAGDLWIVDASGGGHFTSIQTAIDSVADGDFLWVKPGAYGSISIDKSPPASNHAVVIFAMPGDLVTLSGDITIKNLVYGNRVVLRGLESAPSSTGVFTIENCAAGSHVWIEECELRGSAEGLAIKNCASVILTRCAFVGGAGVSGAPEDGIRVEGTPGTPPITTWLSIWETDVQAQDETGTGEPGGRGLVVLSEAKVFAGGCLFRGGDGGPGGGPPTCSVGLGGHGAFVHGTGTLDYMDCMFVAGSTATPQPGCPVPPISSPLAGWATAKPGNVHVTRSTSPVEFCTNMQFTVEGVSGETYVTNISVLPVQLQTSGSISGWVNIWVEDNTGTYLTVEAGTVPSASFPISYPLPSWAWFGKDAQIGYVQTGFHNGSWNFLSSPTSAIFYDLTCP